MPTIYERLEAIGAGAVIVLGLVLLFFPEPSTSVVGGLMVLIGLGIWVTQWRKMKREGTIDEEVAVAEA